jgi:U3 small nucleolar RNA-associated protein 11
MKERLHFIGAPHAAKHKVFLDSKEEAAAFDPAAFFDCPPELVGRAYNRPRRAQLENEAAVTATDAKTTAKMER